MNSRFDIGDSNLQDQITFANYRKFLRKIITTMGDDPDRPGLKDTPERVYHSYLELYGGYHWSDEQIACMLTTFDGEPCDEMVVLRDIEMFSTCEHHLLPFVGVAHVAYVPSNNRVIGISELARLLEVYSRRLQIQERICRQVTEALMKFLKPKGAACLIEAKHLCISCRGVNKQKSSMMTSSLVGCFKEDPVCRLELMSYINRS